MAVPHDETVAYHEAGHLVIARRSGVEVPYKIYLETEHGQLDGHLGARESYDNPEAAQAVVRFAYAGPLAELRRLAIDEFGAGTMFDLEDAAADLLSANGHAGQIRLRFVRDGVSHEFSTSAGPFGNDINRVRSIIAGGHITEAHASEQIRRVREELNSPHVWAQVQRTVELLLAAWTDLP